jgi:hypothetical protein
VHFSRFTRRTLVHDDELDRHAELVDRLLQLAAADRDAGLVLEQLAHRARAEGAAGLYGRIEPRLFAPLSERPCLIRFAPGWMLVHSRREEVVSAIVSGSALLTRMEGEWW